MQPENKNECLGEIGCSTCEGVAYVYKNKKGILYSRCGACGCDQRTGAKVQALFADFQPIGAVAEKLAAGVEAPNPEAAALEPELVSENEAAAVAYECEPEAKPKSKKPLILAGVGAIALAVVSII